MATILGAQDEVKMSLIAKVALAWGWVEWAPF
jgi:hypothetical protein